MSRHQRVFVYGTLMRGGRHHDLLARAAFLGAARTPAVYELYLIDYYPALVRGGATSVVGEVYDVDDATLLALDELEECPAYYVREPIQLLGGEPALTYLLPRARLHDARPIPSGDFRRMG